MTKLRGQEPATPARRRPVEFGRREFFAGGVAAGAALATAAPLLRGAPEAKAEPDPRSLSYRETDHIRTAYRRMRF